MEKLKKVILYFNCITRNVLKDYKFRPNFDLQNERNIKKKIYKNINTAKNAFLLNK